MTNSTSTDEHTNRLIHETSPYLLQHAHNPVDWYPWGPEALERARREGRLILLSIGYSSCHWCHVMERESFEDEEIASLMNEHFVNVKVDREERPDLDEIYMAATQSMNQGRGGWPMTVFLTPNLEPVFAGTYFPPEDRQGIPGFRRLLQTIARAWEQDRDNIRRRASEFAEDLRTRHERTGPPLAVGEQELRGALDGYREAFDEEYGGFGPAPKFPNASGLSLLLRLHRRFDDAHALTMVRTTLDAMARGGIYDHVGGGFCRYATDRKWLVPHFEKMLYDNALLSRVYLEAHQAAGEPLYRRVATETLDYVRREMTAPNGGFYSATDAESEGVEGKFFVWTPEQVREILDDEEARRFNAYYDITPEGNWEGVSIPNAPHSIADVAERLGIGPDDLRESLQEARRKVYEARDQRPKPGLDDKVITAWNGLMIGALSEAFRVLGETRFLEAAERAAGFILEALSREDGALLRTYREGEARLAGYLEDYAYLCQGLVDLYEANGGTRWLRAAERLAERMLQDFTGEDGGALYNTSPEHDDLLMRYREGSDGATPSPNAVAAWSLARLSHHLGRDDFRTAAVQAIKAYGRPIAQYPRGFATSLSVVDFLLEPPLELALVGRRGSDDLEVLRREVARHFLPNRIQTIYDPERDEVEGLPLLEGKQLVDERAALYVCRDFACEAPITDPSEVEASLETDRGGPSRSIAAHLAGRATPEGTARYAERCAGALASSAYARLGATDLTVSRLGFGGYRVHDEREEHGQALRKALTEGINLVDTSTNYADGGSERLVGNIVHDLVIQDEVSRDELVIVSKIGYVQGSNLRLVQEREERGAGFPEVVKYAEGLWHCIHPSFVEDQLDRSLDRLELETLDICLLHNPEYYLSDAARRGVAVEESRDEFYRRLRDAFAQLEMEVAAGRLGAYGVSSNALVLPASDPEATELRRMLDAAREAGGDDHHFAVIQLPLNLLETGALFERDDGSGQTVLEAARSEEIAVLANRPLNAFAGDTLLRLADVRIPEIDVAFDEQLQRVAELEGAFQERLAPHIEPVVEDLAPGDYFRWAEQLQALQPRLTGLAQWSQLEAQISYTVSALTMALNRNLENDVASRWADWRDRYLPELDRLITELTRQAAEHSRDRNGAIVEAIDPLLPEERRIEPLARKALWTVASTPGVTSVLNGMRTPEYVDDALEVLRWPPLEDPRAIYQAPEPI